MTRPPIIGNLFGAPSPIEEDAMELVSNLVMQGFVPIAAATDLWVLILVFPPMPPSRYRQLEDAIRAIAASLSAIHDHTNDEYRIYVLNFHFKDVINEFPPIPKPPKKPIIA